MNSEVTINRDSLVKDYLQRLISKEDILTDSEFYYLLKYSNRYGLSANRTVYKKLLRDADKFGLQPKVMKHNLRNFQWVLDVCRSIVKK